MGLQEIQEAGVEMVCFSEGESGSKGLIVVAIKASTALSLCGICRIAVITVASSSFLEKLIYKFLTPDVWKAFILFVRSLCIFAPKVWASTVCHIIKFEPGNIHNPMPI